MALHAPTVIVTDTPFDPAAAIAAMPVAGAGALASFVGYCRPRTDDGAVQALVIEHYPGFTEKEIARIASHAAARYDLADLTIVHRTGEIPAGDPIVVVAALSAHRAAAFAAVEEIMDYLKTDAPFWKREVLPDGIRWIEPTETDRARRIRWEPKP